MPKPIPNEIRTQIVELRKRGIKPSVISAITSVSARTVSRILCQFKQGDSVLLKRRPGRQPILNAENIDAIKQRIKEKGYTIFLEELRQWINFNLGKKISIPALAATLERYKITHKVVDKRALEGNPIRRALYIAHARSELNPDHMVFIDEVGFNNRTFVRRYGWSPSNMRATARQPFIRGQNYSVIVAMNNSIGIVAYMIIKGSVNKELFRKFLQERLGPCIQPGGANSIVIIDNAKIHHDPSFDSILQSFGGRFHYLPPYSPDFNPIEKLFAVIKTRAKRDYEFPKDDPAMIVATITVLLQSVTAEVCRNIIRSSPYYQPRQ
jgi:transposase